MPKEGDLYIKKMTCAREGDLCLRRATCVQGEQFKPDRNLYPEREQLKACVSYFLSNFYFFYQMIAPQKL